MAITWKSKWLTKEQKVLKEEVWDFRLVWKTYKFSIAGEEINLNLNQKAFADLFITPGEYYGVGVQCYIEIYNPDQTRNWWYAAACVGASQILRNSNVSAYINNRLDKSWLNDVEVDAQLKYLVTQHEDKRTKLGAIKEYNHLKKRVDKKAESNTFILNAWEIDKLEITDVTAYINQHIDQW